MTDTSLKVKKRSVKSPKLDGWLEAGQDTLKSKRPKRSPREKLSEKNGSSVPKKSKRKVSGQPRKSFSESASPVAAEETASVPDSRRQRKRKPAEIGPLTPEERERRQRQRELRELALRLRAEGLPYKRPREPKKTADGPKARKKPRLAGQGKQDDPPDHKYEVGGFGLLHWAVIVIPIFWEARPQEKAEVLSAARTAMDLLKSAGVDAGLDASQTRTPGQKYGFWENRGVMLRVEIGPRDAAVQKCVLAASKTAGEVAAKTTMKVGDALLESIGKALGRQLVASVQPRELVEAAPEPEQLVKKQRTAPVGGDDLAGDFADVTVEAAVEKPKKKKRRRILD